MLLQTKAVYTSITAPCRRQPPNACHFMTIIALFANSYSSNASSETHADAAPTTPFRLDQALGVSNYR